MNNRKDHNSFGNKNFIGAGYDLKSLAQVLAVGAKPPEKLKRDEEDIRQHDEDLVIESIFLLYRRITKKQAKSNNVDEKGQDHHALAAVANAVGKE